MARESARVHEFYMPLHELQPPVHHYHHYDMHQASASSAPSYELTAAAGGGGSACAEAAVAHAHGPHPPPMQPASNQHHHDPRKRKTSHYGSDNYELAGCEVPLAAPQVPLHAPASATRKRKPSSYGSDNYELAGCEVPLAAPQVPLHAPASATRKRKPSSYGTSSAYDDDGGEDARSSRTLPDKKQNHSEIEKRRRDKMNTYISELSAMIPMCGAMARKLDKLTVLRMAVQHLRSVRGALTACPLSARPRPAFLSERELNQLILHAAHDCFLLVVGCNRGRLLYVSASVRQMLHYDQTELLGQSLFDILHPKDVAKVKEQLSSSDLSPRERLIDAKTMLPVKADMQAGASRLCPGARRSFFCRIKCKATPQAVPEPAPVKEDPEPSAKMRKKSNEKKYCVVQCTGYLKSWAPAEMTEAGTSEAVDDVDAGSLSCLVAVGRALPDLAPEPPEPAVELPQRQLQYVSRHAPDGKFLFVDQRVTLALGFLPQELLGTSLYEYVAGPELSAVARAHKAALLSREPLRTPPYTFRRKDGSLARLYTHFKPFKNPWTKDVECLVANNTVVSAAHEEALDAGQNACELYKQKADVEMQRLIESQVESHKIGSAIAEEALRRSSSEFSPELPAELLQDAVFNQNWPLKANVLYEQASLVDNLLGAELAGYSQVRNNVPLSAAASGSPPAQTELEGSPAPSSPPLPPLGLDGNGEAAMAVIMSLLEADAGLGGPVNFSGLPWPLP